MKRPTVLVKVCIFSIFCIKRHLKGSKSEPLWRFPEHLLLMTLRGISSKPETALPYHYICGPKVCFLLLLVFSCAIACGTPSENATLAKQTGVPVRLTNDFQSLAGKGWTIGATTSIARG